MQIVTVLNRRKAVEYCHAAHQSETVMISIGGEGDAAGVFKSGRNRILAILPLTFEDSDVSDGMTDEDAGKVATFVRRYQHVPVVVHCEAGYSRSAGVAAAIMKWANGDDTPIFKGPYAPNMRCYRKVLNALMAEDTDHV